MILWRNIENYQFLSFFFQTPDFPHFYYMLGENLGPLLYGDISVMYYCKSSSVKREANINAERKCKDFADQEPRDHHQSRSCSICN